MSAIIPQDSPTRTLNVRVPLDLYEQLEHLAEATARTKSFVTLEALSSYLEAQSWQVQDIQSGLAEADRSEFASDAEVNAVMSKYGA
jgi:predicted transcriptional regulator